jgi:heme/copper-type cytochrome/quinol oxidase subunit 3
MYEIPSLSTARSGTLTFERAGKVVLLRLSGLPVYQAGAGLLILCFSWLKVVEEGHMPKAQTNREEPDDPDGSLLTLRTTLVLLASVMCASAVGALSYEANPGHSAALALIAAVGAFFTSAKFFDWLISRS